MTNSQTLKGSNLGPFSVDQIVRSDRCGFESDRDLFSGALKDLRGGFAKMHLARALAVEDIRARYMRSVLGVGWVFISFAVFVGVKVVIFTPLAQEGVGFFAPYVAIGFFAWSFIYAAIIDGCASFIGAQGWIKGTRTPLTIYVLQSVMRNLFLTAINLIVVALICLFSGLKLTWVSLAVLPVCVLFVINALWLHFLFSTIGARYRDFVHLVQTIMRVMFFLTPVFWLPEQMGELMKVLIFNPLAHYIFVLRDPILYGTIPWTSVWVVLGCTAAGCAAAFAIFARARQRIVFWL